MLITTNSTNIVTVDAGKDYILSAAGTFGSGTLTPKWSDGTTDVTVAGPSGDITITANAAYVITAPTNTLKLILTGASSPSINANLYLRFR